MAQYINIGLKTNDGTPDINLYAIVDYVGNKLDARPVTAWPVQSDTEPTLVLTAGRELTTTELYDMANMFHQDCVAVYDTTTGSGNLVGPFAAKWGEFNPEYFFMPHGDRLTEWLRQAA